MAALTAPRDTTELHGNPMPKLWRIPVKASTTIYAGAMVQVVGGYAVPAATATGRRMAGRARVTAVNSTGVDGATLVEVERGCFGLDNSGGGDLITQADVGALCYSVDDHTVAKVATGRSVAGMVFQLENGQVYVDTTITA